MTFKLVTDSDLPNMNFTDSGTNPFGFTFTPPALNAPTTFNIEFNRPLEDLGSTEYIYLRFHNDAGEVLGEPLQEEFELKAGNIYGLVNPRTASYSNFGKYTPGTCSGGSNTTGHSITIYSDQCFLRRWGCDVAAVPENMHITFSWNGAGDVSATLYEDTVEVGYIEQCETTATSATAAFPDYLSSSGWTINAQITCADLSSITSGSYTVTYAAGTYEYSTGYSYMIELDGEEEYVNVGIGSAGVISDEYGVAPSLARIHFGDGVVPADAGGTFRVIVDADGKIITDADGKIIKILV